MNESIRTSPKATTRPAADQADDIATLMGRRGRSVQPVVEARLRILEDTLESDPIFTRDQMVYLRNRLRSCRVLNELEEWGAAEYEMREMARKLRHWQGGDEDGLPVRVLDPEPLLPASVAAAEPVCDDAR